MPWDIPINDSFKNYSMISNYYFDKVFFKPIKSIVEKYFKENSENEIKNHLGFC